MSAAATPKKQAIPGAGKGGVIPPPEHRFKPGQSGNPQGRRSYGACVKDWLNSLNDAPDQELQKIVRNDKTPAAKATAALRVLRSRQRVDPADFEPVVTGKKTLEQLSAEGVDTSVVKKITRREGKDGVSVALEFHDWAGQDFDRLMDRTEGKPPQAYELSGPNGGPIQTEHKVTAGLISLLGGESREVIEQDNQQLPDNGAEVDSDGSESKVGDGSG